MTIYCALFFRVLKGEEEFFKASAVKYRLAYSAGSAKDPRNVVEYH